MRKIKNIIGLITVFVCLAIIGVVASNVSASEQEYITTDIIDGEYYFEVGDEKPLNTALHNSETKTPTFNYEVSDLAVILVDENGLVKALSPGYSVVTITAKDSNADPISIYFEVTEDISKAEVKVDHDVYTYRGKEINAKTEVVINGKTLITDEDYSLSYENNINVGIATITIIGQNYYTGEIKKQFTIKQLDLETVAKYSYDDKHTYTGFAIKPKLKISIYGSLIQSRDTKITYSNNINTGVATILVEAKGDNTTGSKTLEFKIQKAKLSTVKAAEIAKQTYTGNLKKPTAKLTLGKYKLKVNKDYSVKYYYNRNIGKAAIVVSSKGNNFTGVKKVWFQIVPKANRPTAYYDPTTSTLKIKFTKVSYATGYRVYIYSDSKKCYVYKKRISSKNISKIKLTGLSSGKTYKVKMMSFKTVNGKNYYSYLSATTLNTTTTPATARFTQLCGENNSIFLRWKKQEGVTGYKVYRYDTNKKRYKLIKVIKGDSNCTYTNKNLPKNRRLYYKIITYKKLGSKIYYAPASSAKSAVTISFLWPNQALDYVSQGFYSSSDMYSNGRHLGLDLVKGNGISTMGAAIRATKGGYVDYVDAYCPHNYGKFVSCGCGYGYGKFVTVRSTIYINGKAKTIRIIYGHMSKVYVKQGQYVSQGQLLGLVGSTGFSTGAHLHLEFRLQKDQYSPVTAYLNPLRYVRRKN